MNSVSLRPLTGITVLDLSQAAAGPICANYLAAYGADVIKIERPDTGDMARRTPPYAGAAGVTPTPTTPIDISSTILKRNRGKKSLALDLASPDGLAIIKALVAKADVVVENFRPGVTEKLGIDFASLAKINSDLVYCSITGFGMTGPYKNWSAFDTIIQGMTGVMATTGYPDGPPTKTGLIVGDTYAPLFALSGILAALMQRGRTGEAQFIEVSMFDCLVSLVWDEPIEYYAEHRINTRSGNRFLRMAPWNAYRSSDGYVVICAGQQEHWRRVCELVGHPEWFAEPRFATMEARLKNVEELDRLVEAWTQQLPRAEVVARCQAMGIPCGPVNELEDLIRDRNLAERGLLRPLLHPISGEVPNAGVPEFPVRFSGFSVSSDEPAPALGQHTREVLATRLGFADADIDALAAKGVVKLGPVPR